MSLSKNNSPSKKNRAAEIRDRVAAALADARHEFM